MFIIQSQNLVSLPLFASAVSCGFVSPAEDYIEKYLSLDKLLIKNPTATFFVRATGDSMRETIKEGDLLVVDRSLEARHGSIILAVIDGEFTVKRLHKINNQIHLYADNPKYKKIQITEEMDFRVWGVIVHVIHSPLKDF